MKGVQKRRGRGQVKFYLYKKGVEKVLDRQFSHFVAPPPPVPMINNQSLMLVYDMVKIF